MTQPERSAPYPPVALLQRALAVLEARREDSSVWPALARSYRQAGRLDEARAVYAKLGPAGAEALQVLGGEGGAASLDSGLTPFVRVDGFLSGAEQAALWALFAREAERFTPSRVGLPGQDRVDSEVRTSLTLPGPSPERRAFRRRVREEIGEVAGRLQTALQEPLEIEVRFRRYGDGHFYHPHSDDNRDVSFVYFLLGQQSRFQGGDLLLFDRSGGASWGPGFTRLRPEGNAIVFFPSSSVHCVTPVACGEAFLEGRFVVNGHVRGGACPAGEGGRPARA